MDYDDTVDCKTSSPNCNAKMNCTGFETCGNLCVVKHDPLASCHLEIMLWTLGKC